MVEFQLLGIMNRQISTLRLWIEIVFAATIGSGELVLMKFLDAHPSVAPYEFIYPSVAGLLLGIFGGGPVWIIGPATMLCLPIGMAVSMVAGGHGFNLWPIALAFFGVLAIIGLCGAAIGRKAKQCWTK